MIIIHERRDEYKGVRLEVRKNPELRTLDCPFHPSPGVAAAVFGIWMCAATHGCGVLIYGCPWMRWVSCACALGRDDVVHGMIANSHMAWCLALAPQRWKGAVIGEGPVTRKRSRLSSWKESTWHHEEEAPISMKKRT